MRLHSKLQEGANSNPREILKSTRCRFRLNEILCSSKRHAISARPLHNWRIVWQLVAVLFNSININTSHTLTSLSAVPSGNWSLLLWRSWIFFFIESTFAFKDSYSGNSALKSFLYKQRCS